MIKVFMMEARIDSVEVERNKAGTGEVKVEASHLVVTSDGKVERKTMKLAAEFKDGAGVDRIVKDTVDTVLTFLPAGTSQGYGLRDWAEQAKKPLERKEPAVPSDMDDGSEGDPQAIWEARLREFSPDERHRIVEFERFLLPAVIGQGLTLTRRLRGGAAWKIGPSLVLGVEHAFRHSSDMQTWSVILAMLAEKGKSR